MTRGIISCSTPSWFKPGLASTQGSRKHYKRGGRAWTEGHWQGFFKCDLSTLYGVRAPNETRNPLRNRKGPVPKCELARGVHGVCFPGEVLKLRFSEIAGNVHLASCFLHHHCCHGGQPSYTKRDTLPESLKSAGGHVPRVLPVPTSILQRI